MTQRQCWQCGSSQSGAIFCDQCNALQPPPGEYFEFFGLPRQLSLDSGELQKTFYALSRRLHPDRYSRASERERNYSLEASSILNDGYRTLRDPIKRAEYCLKANGFDIGEQRSKDVPPELLEEVFELNMALDELKSGDEDAIPQLEESRGRFNELLEEIAGEVDAAFALHDKAADDAGRMAALQQLRGILNRRRYIQNLTNEVDKQLTAHAS